MLTNFIQFLGNVRTYEFIPEVNTKILWPRKRQVGVAYCRILLGNWTTRGLADAAKKEN